MRASTIAETTIATQQEPELGRHAQNLALAEREEPLRIAAHRARLADALGQAAIERERRKGHDQGRHADSRDEPAVERSRRAAPATQRDRDRGVERQAEVLPGRRRAGSRVRPMIEPTERSMPPVMMMKVIGSATSADLGHQPALVEQVAGGEEAVGLVGEHDQRGDQDQQEDALVAQERARVRSSSRGRLWAMVATNPPSVPWSMQACSNGSVERPRFKRKGACVQFLVIMCGLDVPSVSMHQSGASSGGEETTSYSCPLSN